MLNLNNKYLTALIFFIEVSVLFLIIVISRSGNGPLDRTRLTNPEDLAYKPVALEVESRLLIGGDIFLGRAVERNSLASELLYKYPFQNIMTLKLNEYQAVIANLECPSTDEHVSFQEQATILKFNCLPEFLPTLSAYFDVVSLANNHTDNVKGMSGLEETRTNLELSGIQYFGHYDSSVTDELCEVISVEARIIYEDFNLEKAQIPIAMCGYHGVFAIPLDEQLAEIKKYSKYLPTIVLPHMGQEYVTSSDSIRERVYRQMIDNGADVVAGGHPHWIQNTEVYKGRLIIYSMGNLIFDQQANLELRRSLMLDTTLRIGHDENTEKWLGLAETCDKFKDDCLERAKQAGLKKLQASFKHEIVGTVMDSMIVRKADSGEQKAIEERANWAQTSAELGNN